jgi:4-hydroxy-4-methyl-2-oxoglutarate aldolase
MDYEKTFNRMAALDACAVSDALDSLGVDGVVNGIVRRSTDKRIVGRVQTMKLSAGAPPAGSNTHLGTRSIEAATSTDVIVVQQKTGVNAAGWGGVLATAAKEKGIRGVIVDGPARDVDEYEDIGLPVFSRSVTPRTARGRIYESGVNVGVEIGEVSVNPGDLVIADGSGVVFIPAEMADKVLDAAESVVAREKLMVEAVKKGEPVTAVMGKDYETMLGTQK